MDTNILVDFATRRVPHAEAAEALLVFAHDKEVVLGAAAMSLPFAYYVAWGDFGDQAKVMKAVERLYQYVEVVEMDQLLIRSAMDNSIEDLEDAVQFECARRYHASYIISRDAMGFGGLEIPTEHPIFYIEQKTKGLI